MTVELDQWPQPFSASEVDNPCPNCPEEFLRVQDCDPYYDNNEYQAYCPNCHSIFDLVAHVDVSFSLEEP